MERSENQRSVNLLLTALLSILGILLLIGALAFAAMLFTAGSSAGGTLASGRKVSVNSDGLFLSSQFSGDTATIETDGLVIVVEPTKLVIDGKTIAEINSTSNEVEVTVRGGGVEFTVDGQSVSGP